VGELELYIGKDDPSNFKVDNLVEDGPRTWLTVDKAEPVYFNIHILDIRGHAHLAIQKDGSEAGLSVQEYKGDFTGTMHVGNRQHLDLSANENSVIPFTIRAYRVGEHSLNIHISLKS